MTQHPNTKHTFWYGESEKLDTRYDSMKAVKLNDKWYSLIRLNNRSKNVPGHRPCKLTEAKQLYANLRKMSTLNECEQTIDEDDSMFYSQLFQKQLISTLRNEYPEIYTRCKQFTHQYLLNLNMPDPE